MRSTKSKSSFLYRGTPQTRDYPGDPAEIEFEKFTCKDAPTVAEWFAEKVYDDDKLFDRVAEHCWEAVVDDCDPGDY